jgi:subtilisin family serine protease
MALKFYDNSGAGFNNLANTVKALQYAVNANVDIINYSGGGSDSSAAEMDVIKQARAKGIYLVASAGNDGEDLSKVPYYPASYNYENVIPVAGHDKNNELRKFSSYGKYVFVAAPGFSVLSAIPNDQYSTMSGTSQATAFVTGALAYILSQDIGPVKSSMSQIKLKLSKATKELKNNKDKSLTQWGSLYLPNLPKD